MPKKSTKPIAENPIEDALRRVHTIGELEQVAGIGRTLEERAAFWIPYKDLPPRESVDAGVAELRRLARFRATQARGGGEKTSL